MDINKVIEDKKDVFIDLIKKYKTYIQNDGLRTELYKWTLFERQGGMPTLNSNTIHDELIGLNYGNLLYYNVKPVMRHLRRDRAIEYSNLLIELYNEKNDLSLRIKEFDEALAALYEQLIPNKYSHHHDERTIALLLSFKYPEKYLIYKNSFYSILCRVLGIKSEKKNKKYVHYLDIAETIKNKFLRNDDELNTLIRSKLPVDSFDDVNLNLLTQDFLYTMFEKVNSNYELRFKNVKDLFNAKVNSLDNCEIGVGADQNKDFQRIKDRFNIIGSDDVHYELYCEGATVYVDFHIEKNSELPLDVLKALEKYLKSKEYDDNEVCFFDWRGKNNSSEKFQSLRYNTEFSLDEEDIFKEETIAQMIDSFRALDRVIGTDVREFLIEKQQISSDLASQFKKTNLKKSLNLILYGPPGTGKTYKSISAAVKIVNSDFLLIEDRKLIKEEYKRLVDMGQIVFTTFHQSMTYEDFVEGIKPDIDENEDGVKSVIYDINEGLFKNVCINAAASVEFEKQEIFNVFSFDDAYTALVREANIQLEKNDPLFLSIQTENLGLKITAISGKGNLILKPIYSDDSKEYIVSYSRAQRLQNAFPDLSVIKNIDKEFRQVIGGSNSTAYWAVINWINARVNTNTKSEEIKKLLPKKNFVLIIDEINRGNVSAIFGELITLIEEDKRIGNAEEIQVSLPYSKTKFGVPNNLYIIGTMNTADRSVEALDTALRRRFTFEEMMPNYELLESDTIFNIDLKFLLETINERIEVLLDRDHLIGHSYFLNVNTIEDLKLRFKNSIIPLLQEYFFGDYGKIGLILGPGFIGVKPNNKIVFAEISGYDGSLWDEKVTYTLNKDLSDEAFRLAIDNMLSGKHISRE